MRAVSFGGKVASVWPMKPVGSWVVLLALCGAAYGCDGSDEAESAAPQPAGKKPPGDGVEGASKRAEEEPAPTQQLAQAAGAADPVAPDPRYCEHAHTSFVAMIAEMKKKGQPGQSRVPDKSAFLEACGTLPVPMQRCMMVGYAARHREECERIKEDVDQDLIARVQRVLDGSGP